MGAWSDRIGRKPMLVTSIFSTAIGWFIFAAAPSIPFLFLGRIVDGLAAGNFPIAQSYLSDLSKTDKERTANFGLIGAVFGVGFILGPFLGGVLAHFGPSVPFWAVGGLALCNAFMAMRILPETHIHRSSVKISVNPFIPLRRAITDIPLRINYTAWLLFGFAIATYQSVFSLYMRDIFGFTEFLTGVIFGATGVIIAFNQGFAMKHIWLRYFKEPVLELTMLLLFSVGFILLDTHILWIFGIGLLLTTFGHSVLRVVMTSQIVGASGKDRRGEVLGILSSVTSLSMTIAPLIAGILYEANTSLPFILSAIAAIASFFLLYSKKKKLSQGKLPENIVVESGI